MCGRFADAEPGDLEVLVQKAYFASGVGLLVVNETREANGPAVGPGLGQ